MKLIDACRLASDNLKRTKTRTFLTQAGVIVSITAIVLLVSLGVGLQKLSVSRLASISALTRLTVLPKDGSDKVLDHQALKKFSEIPGVDFVSPELQFPATASLADLQSDVMVTGLDGRYLSFSDINVVEGTEFSGEKSDEAIISKAALKLFGKENVPGAAIGNKIRLQIYYEVDGKSSPKEIIATIVGTTDGDTIASVYLPLNSIFSQDTKSYNSVSLKVLDRQDMKQIKKTVEDMGFQTTTVSDLIDQIDQAFLYFQIILGIIGGIALFVASIGIVNTMTISLLERTHEIGIMKALGARNSEIKKIFIYESGIIGLTGSLFGVGSGWLIGQLTNLIVTIILKASGQDESIVVFVMPLNFAVAVLLISTILAITAGIYPARRAAKLSPLQALKYQ